jgi:hypothetical protein
MKIRFIAGVIITALGLLIALGPQFLFKVCEVMGEKVMKCHWSAQAEIGAGAVIAGLGVALTVFASPKIRFGLVIGAFLTGILALLIPHALIGGCGMPTMACRKVAFPGITVASILLLAAAGLYLVYLAKKKD